MKLLKKIMFFEFTGRLQDMVIYKVSNNNLSNALVLSLLLFDIVFKLMLVTISVYIGLNYGTSNEVTILDAISLSLTIYMGLIYLIRIVDNLRK